jgi:hypothetical protein
MILSTPLNTTAEILFELITKGSVSMKEFSWMEGFRTRVSELNRKHHIPLSKTTEKGENKHGNAIRYHRHSLPNDKVEFALEVYQKINQN